MIDDAGSPTEIDLYFLIDMSNMYQAYTPGTEFHRVAAIGRILYSLTKYQNPLFFNPIPSLQRYTKHKGAERKQFSRFKFRHVRDKKKS